MPSARATSSSKALAAILPQIAEGHAYEAHQKARTFASRYVKSAQYDTAIDVLFQSARALLTASQPGSGTDLASFLIDVYESKGEVVSEESRGRLTQLIALTVSSGSWRKTLIDRAVAWTTKAGPCPAGDPELHHYIGNLLYKERAFDQAEPHFLAAGKRDSARLLAQMMSQWWQAASASSSPGPFALRGTIPYLLNGNILAARTFITHFVLLVTSASPSLRSDLAPSVITFPVGSGTDEIVFTTDQVFNFLQLAVRTCQRAQSAQGPESKKAQEAWIRLNGTYLGKGGVLAQPGVRNQLNEIATLFFGLPPPRNQAANPLGDMFSSLFGGVPITGTGPRTLTPGPSAAGLD